MTALGGLGFVVCRSRVLKPGSDPTRGLGSPLTAFLVVVVLESFGSAAPSMPSFAAAAARSAAMGNTNRSRAMHLARSTASDSRVLFSRSECSLVSSGAVD